MNVLNAEQMHAADAHAIDVLKIPSLALMENAATHVAKVVTSRHVQPRAVSIVCGKGNNGGDGMAVAWLLKQSGWNPAVLLLGKSNELKADPAENWKRAIQAGAQCIEIADSAELDRYFSQSDLIVDALFGTGLTKPLEGIHSDAVQRINRAGKEVIAVDVPSGLSSDTGELFGPAVRADVTVALAALKVCHVLAPACKMCGEICVADIGIPTESTTNVVRVSDVRRLLPHRKPDSHKGTYGHAAIVAGSTGKSGAAYLAGKAALRCGAGLVTVASPSRVQPIIASLGPEIMTHPAAGTPDTFNVDAATGMLNFLVDKTAVAIGPGIGTEQQTLTFLQIIVPQIQAPLVIDADGLNLVARDKTILRKRKPLSMLLTPHPGEMGRLLGVDSVTVQKDRIGCAGRLASETQAVVILKGFRSIVAEPKGRIWINLTGGHALASAGTGDILTGILTGFLAQGLMPLEAALAGVFLHGLASNLFEAEFPQQAMNALDILNYWNRTVHLVRTAHDLEGEYLKIHFGV